MFLILNIQMLERGLLYRYRYSYNVGKLLRNTYMYKYKCNQECNGFKERCIVC